MIVRRSERARKVIIKSSRVFDVDCSEKAGMPYDERRARPPRRQTSRIQCLATLDHRGVRRPLRLAAVDVRQPGRYFRRRRRRLQRFNGGHLEYGTLRAS